MIFLKRKIGELQGGNEFIFMGDTVMAQKKVQQTLNPSHHALLTPTFDRSLKPTQEGSLTLVYAVVSFTQGEDTVHCPRDRFRYNRGQ